jgi:hypothetical protein
VGQALPPVHFGFDHQRFEDNLRPAGRREVDLGEAAAGDISRTHRSGAISSSGRKNLHTGELPFRE